jgi:hypothetical protein
MVAYVSWHRIFWAGWLLVGRFATHGSFFFLSPKSFKELAGYSDDEKKRLWQQASKEMFRCWRSLLPVMAFAFVISFAVALGMTIPKVTTLPDNLWVEALMSGLIMAVAGKPVERLMVIWVRPFLQNAMARTSLPG